MNWGRKHLRSPWQRTSSMTEAENRWPFRQMSGLYGKKIMMYMIWSAWGRDYLFRCLFGIFFLSARDADFYRGMARTDSPRAFSPESNNHGLVALDVCKREVRTAFINWKKMFLCECTAIFMPLSVVFNLRMKKKMQKILSLKQTNKPQSTIHYKGFLQPGPCDNSYLYICYNHKIP